MKYEFRGKRRTKYNDNGTWIYGYLQDREVIRGVIKERVYEICEVYPETISQFTGIVDNKQQKIFAGDIARDKDGKIFIIEWNNRRCGYVARYADHNDFEAFDECFANYHELDVIGNIHDSEHLIKQPVENTADSAAAPETLEG